jgi:hypothetical protein
VAGQQPKELPPLPVAGQQPKELPPLPVAGQQPKELPPLPFAGQQPKELPPLPVAGQQTQQKLSKSAKKKLKRNKSRTSTSSATSADDEDKIEETATKILSRSGSEKEGSTDSTSAISAEKEKQLKRRNNLSRFMEEYKKSSGEGRARRESSSTSASRGTKIVQSGLSKSVKEELTKFLDSSRSRSTERQKPGTGMPALRPKAESHHEFMFLHKCKWSRYRIITIMLKTMDH